ncbi:MAG: hypothetical protein WC346_06290 [Methanogenium sp.]|jgi:cell shape-determining protein MreC
MGVLIKRTYKPDKKLEVREKPVLVPDETIQRKNEVIKKPGYVPKFPQEIKQLKQIEDNEKAVRADIIQKEIKEKELEQIDPEQKDLEQTEDLKKRVKSKK